MSSDPLDSSSPISPPAIPLPHPVPPIHFALPPPVPRPAILVTADSSTHPLAVHSVCAALASRTGALLVTHHDMSCALAWECEARRRETERENDRRKREEAERSRKGGAGEGEGADAAEGEVEGGDGSGETPPTAQDDASDPPADNDTSLPTSPPMPPAPTSHPILASLPLPRHFSLFVLADAALASATPGLSFLASPPQLSPETVSEWAVALASSPVARSTGIVAQLSLFLGTGAPPDATGKTAPVLSEGYPPGLRLPPLPNLTPYLLHLHHPPATPTPYLIDQLTLTAYPSPVALASTAHWTRVDADSARVGGEDGEEREVGGVEEAGTGWVHPDGGPGGAEGGEGEGEWADDGASVEGDEGAWVEEKAAPRGGGDAEAHEGEDGGEPDPDEASRRAASGVVEAHAGEQEVAVVKKRTKRVGWGGRWRPVPREVLGRLVPYAIPPSSTPDAVPTLPLPAPYHIHVSALQHPRRTARAAVAHIMAAPCMPAHIAAAGVGGGRAGVVPVPGSGQEAAEPEGGENTEADQGTPEATHEADPTEAFSAIPETAAGTPGAASLEAAVGLGVPPGGAMRTVACDGWDVVEASAGRCVRGKPGYAVVWRGAAFFFASEVNGGLFAADPDRYVATAGLPYPAADPRPHSVSIHGPAPVRLVVTGTHPSIGELGRSLSTRLGATLVDPRVVVAHWRARGAEADGAIPPALVGSPLDPDSAEFLAAVVKEVLSGLEKEGKGWVVCGFPVSGNEAGHVKTAQIPVGEAVVWWGKDNTAEEGASDPAATQVKTALISLEGGPRWCEISPLISLAGAAHKTLRAARPWAVDPAVTASGSGGSGQILRRVPGGAHIGEGDDADDAGEDEGGEDSRAVVMGPAGVWCPVRLNLGQVVRGKKRFGVKWRGCTWWCAGESEQKEALAAPEEFLGSLPREVPLRMCVVGAVGCGAPRVASWIAGRKGRGNPGEAQLDVVEFGDAYLTTIMARAEEKDRETFATAVRDSPLELPDALISMIVEDLYGRPGGFVVCGFPRTETEVEVVLAGSKGLDCVVRLKVDKEVAVGREAPKRAREAEERVARARAEGSEREEGVDMAVIEEEVGDMYDKDSESVDAVAAAFSRHAIVPVVEVDANKCERVVHAELDKSVGGFLVGRCNMLACPTPIEAMIVEDTLKSGVVSLSEMGLYDPVTVMKSLQGRFGTISRHQFRPFVNLALLRVQTAKSANLEQEQEAKDEDEPPLEAPALHGPFACILGSRVFVFHNETNLNAFCREPYRYVPRTDAFAGLIPAVQGMALAPDSGQVPPHSRVAAQGALGVGLFVLGGAKANEVAMKVAEDLGMEHLTIDLAVKDLLEVEDSVEVDEGKRIVVREQNDLVDRVAAAVAAGGLSDDLKVEVLMEVVRRARAATRGWVLSGFPETIIHAQLLEEALVTPQLIVELVDPHNGTTSNNLPTIRSFYTSRYSTWTAIPSSVPMWSLRVSVARRFAQVLSNRSTYGYRVGMGWAAGVDDCGAAVRRDEVEKRVDRRYGKCCAVTFVRDGELEVCEGERWTVEYKNAFFRTKIHTEMDLFLADPSRYTRNFRSVPETLPAARSRNAVKALFPKEMEMQGYCPVTYVEEEDDRFREGDKDCVAEFAGKLYAMENSEKLVKFLRKPWLYTNFRAPSSLPLRKIVVPLSQLPMVSYLEKTVASAVMSAISSVARVKPKFPYKSLDASAAEYVGLYLKANHPQAQPWVRDRYAAKLESFRQVCGVTAELASRMPTLGYVPEERREKGLDEKMNNVVKRKPPSKGVINMGGRS